MNETKEVRFDLYCKYCKHSDEDEFDPKSVCYECLEHACNYDSSRPVDWEKKV